MSSRSELDGLVAIVTGSSRGLGRHIAVGLAEQGADVGVTFRNDAEGGKETAALVEALGRRAAVVQVDVTREDQVERLMGTTSEELGPISILVNNAGVSIDGVVWRLAETSWDEVVETNLRGTFLCTKHALPVMAASGFGRIINIASVVGQRGVPGTGAYAASKAGVLGLTRSVAAECAARGVTVNALALGYFEEGMLRSLPEEIQESIRQQIPLRRFGTMEELKWAVQFLASPRAGYVNGAVVDVNGGLR